MDRRRYQPCGDSQRDATPIGLIPGLNGEAARAEHLPTSRVGQCRHHTTPVVVPHVDPCTSVLPAGHRSSTATICAAKADATSCPACALTEFVVIPVGFVSPLPAGTTFATGACLGVPAFTAYAAVLADGPVEGKTILLQGGAGSVGELAVQLAPNAGAAVIATVSSDHKARRAQTRAHTTSSTIARVTSRQRSATSRRTESTRS